MDKIVVSPRLDVTDLVSIYSAVVEWLREEDDPRFSGLVESLSKSLSSIDGFLNSAEGKGIKRKMLAGLREGVREFPVLLKSIAPDKAERIVLRLRLLVDRANKSVV